MALDTLAADMQECNYEAASWYKTRETTQITNWYTAADNLAGTSQYGQ